MIIKFQLCHHSSSGSITAGNKRKPKAESCQHYSFDGEVFAFARAINRITVDTLTRSLDQHDLEP